MKSSAFRKLFSLFSSLIFLFLFYSPAQGAESSAPAWFDKNRVNVFIVLALFFAFVIYFINRAQKGKSLFVRRIPGLDAIEEAVGRATEMGRPILYISGIEDMDNLQTVASMIILGNVAEMAAAYEVPLLVPVCQPFVVTVAEESVKQGYAKAGKPEAYNPNNVRFLTSEQFAYASGVNGIMLREKPAANFMFGSFYAESLLMAETGFSTGAIQVAGTANIHQLPFFVVACDYTLIGEELFAASAYLSKEPKLLGSLKGSDLAKLLIMIYLVLGVLFVTFGIDIFLRWVFVQ
ncbi:MAG: hypothetical protein Q8O10_05605 [candidate division Zixibacteria bacterium]|nr:hypothetical protein [candidate division Zixibacteria bacterium]